MNFNVGSGCVLWGPVAGGMWPLSNRGFVSEELFQTEFSYEGRNKERSTLRGKAKCRTRGEIPNESLKKTKPEGNRRWEIEARGKQKGGNSNLPTEITWEKCSSEKKRGYDLCQRTSFHATATTGLHYSEPERGRERKIGVERKKKELLFCFTYYPLRKWPCSWSLPTHSTPPLWMEWSGEPTDLAKWEHLWIRHDLLPTEKTNRFSFTLDTDKTGIVFML